MQTSSVWDLSPPLTTISRWTLAFGDARLEEQLKAARILSLPKVMITWACLFIFFTSVAGYFNKVHMLMVLAFSAAACGVVHVGTRVFHFSGYQTHCMVAKLYQTAGLLSVLPYWWYTYTGRLQRLGPDESLQMLSCCCLWAIGIVMPHILHFSMKERAAFYVHALTVVATSPHWKQHLLLAILLGEGIGHTVEHILREGFLFRTHSLLEVERLAREKERMEYDMLLAQHQSAALAAGAGRGASPSHGRSEDTNSEILQMTTGLAEQRSAGKELIGHAREAGRDPEWEGMLSHRLVDASDCLRSDRDSSSACSDGATPLHGTTDLSRQREYALWSCLAEIGIKPHSQ
jgi:hypothetical protein